MSDARLNRLFRVLSIFAIFVVVAVIVLVVMMFNGNRGYDVDLWANTPITEEVWNDSNPAEQNALYNRSSDSDLLAYHAECYNIREQQSTLRRDVVEDNANFGRWIYAQAGIAWENLGGMSYLNLVLPPDEGMLGQYQVVELPFEDFPCRGVYYTTEPVPTE